MKNDTEEWQSFVQNHHHRRQLNHKESHTDMDSMNTTASKRENSK